MTIQKYVIITYFLNRDYKHVSEKIKFKAFRYHNHSYMLHMWKNHDKCDGEFLTVCFTFG